jgi:A nuclease of the HNH/ENDO VII superfamily with conserved WHH
VTVLEHISPADVARAIETHPRLSSAVTEIASKTGLPKDVVRSHLTDALRDALDVLGETYVKQMGDTIAAVDSLRDQVHEFYDRVLNGEDPNPDTARLSSLFAQLHEKVLQLSDPQQWARMQSQLDILGAMSPDIARGTPVHDQPVGGRGTATEGLSGQKSSGPRSGGRIPRADGGWDGEPGNSPWVSFNPEVTRITQGEPVEYVDGEPVLAPYAVEEVILTTMTGRNTPDFRGARDGLMRQYPGRWRNVTHVEAWEGGGVPDSWGNALAEPHTWHHEPDVESMSLVPTALHGNLPHEGGASAARRGLTPVRVAPFATNPLESTATGEGDGDDE